MNEAAVAAELKLGRTPVHQAFDRLAREGLVDVIPRRGVIVRPLRLDEIIQVIEARLLNEAYAVRLATQRASPAEILALGDVLARAEAAVEEGDADTSMLLDGEFHALIADAAKNSILADILLNLNERSLRLWSISLSSPGHIAEIAGQHRAIFEAISHRDPAGAEAAMREHVDSFRRTVLGRL